MINLRLITSIKNISEGKLQNINTKPEVLLRKKLYANGIRYRISNKHIIGKPDIFINKWRIAIFIDGEFWHGFNWSEKKKRIKSNRGFWIPKIERNIERDLQVNEMLDKKGYKVFRFWSNQILKDVNHCVDIILEHIKLKSNET